MSHRNARPRVLVFSYHFDIDTEIGARRARLFARLLPLYGWRVTVITAGDPAHDVIEPDLVVRHVPSESAAYRLKEQVGVDAPRIRNIRGSSGAKTLRARLIVLTAALVDFVPATLAWSRRAVRVARSEAKARPAAAIMSTSPPQTTHIAAWRLSRRLRLPWVAELRDLWSQNADREAHWLRRVPDRFVEENLLRPAAALVTVSPPLADRLTTLHRHPIVRSIPTGFDPAILAPDDQPISSRFNVVYTGRIYPGYQHLGLFLRPLRRAIDSGRILADQVDVDLVLAGPLDDRDRAIVEELDLTRVVRIVPAVPHAEAIERQRQAQIVLHLRWDDPKESGVTTGKLAEYLAARRPILSTGQYVDVVVDVLSATGSGKATCSEDETVEFLAESYESFRRTGRVPYLGDPEAVESFDAREAARAMAELLDSLVDGT